jgi:competence ComEA-like helix-hairpin-helix protein
MLYSRRQLGLLLVFAVIFLAGLGIREWRVGFPDAAQRLERFDHEDPPTPLPSASEGETRAQEGETRALSPTAAPKTAEVNDVPPRPAAPPVAAAPVATPSRPLDLNRATVAELARLPGVGPGLAQRILEERERRGRFDSPDALRQIVGLGPKKLAALHDLVTVGE